MCKDPSEQDADRLSRGFAPVVSGCPRVLLLGSLPGALSLAKQQYYAQPRNAFWSIMSALCGAGPDAEYEYRIARLAAAGIALWDVLAAAERPGSLDSAIVESSVRTNNFDGFFRTHASIGAVFFNGKKAAQLFEKRVLPGLDGVSDTLVRATLPSTSPAFASMTVARKQEIWLDAIGPLLRP